jgi:hypothetical protein
MAFLRKVCGRLVAKYGFGFGLGHLVELLRAEPQLMDMNRYCVERSVR